MATKAKAKSGKPKTGAQGRTKSTPSPKISGPVAPDGRMPLVPYDMGGWLISGGGGNQNVQTFDIAPPGTYDTYDKVARYPTSVLALTKLNSPITRTEWKWKKHDDAPKSWLKEMQTTFDPLRSELLELYVPLAERYGWQSGEVVWDVTTGRNLGISEFKGLSARETELLFDKATGEAAGVRNEDANGRKTDLLPQNSFTFIFNSEPGMPYGNPLCENVRPRWGEVNKFISRAAMWVSKISNVVPIIHYPVGQSQFFGSSKWPNQYFAQYLLNKLVNGEGITIPNEFATVAGTGETVESTSAMMDKALAGADKSSWHFDFMEPKATNFLAGFVLLLSYYDALIIRGFMLPERTLIQGMHGGSRAETQVHDNTADYVSELIYAGFVRQLSHQTVNDCLEMRYGPAARGAVWIEAPKLSNEGSQTIEKIILAAIASKNQAVSDLAASIIDFDASADELHVPVLKENRGKWKSAFPPAPKPMPATNGKPMNGNGKRITAGAED